MSVPARAAFPPRRRSRSAKSEEQRRGAEGADPAVAHDLEAPVAGRPTEAVGGVGKAVLVQGAGREHHGSRPPVPAGEPGAETEGESAPRTAAPGRVRAASAYDREDTRTGAEIRQRMGSVLPRQSRHREPAVEAHATGEIAATACQPPAGAASAFRIAPTCLHPAAIGRYRSRLSRSAMPAGPEPSHDRCRILAFRRYPRA